jgi:hypothetical protein
MPAAEAPVSRDGLAFRGKHWRLWMGLDGIVRCRIEGDHDQASVLDLMEAFHDLAAKVPERPLRILVYANRLLSLGPDARESLVNACKVHVQWQLAVVRASPLGRIQARAIARASGREFSFHENERDALRALGVEEQAKPPAPALPRPEPVPAVPNVGVLDHIT